MHPDISETAVLGVPDAMWGEVGVAVCVAREGADISSIDLRAYLEGKNGPLQAAKDCVVLECAAKSAYGKITKKMIREELEKRGQMPAFEESRQADRRLIERRRYDTKEVRKERAVAITGGASGIGFSTAQLLLARGWQPWLLDLKREALDIACEKLGIDLSARPPLQCCRRGVGREGICRLDRGRCRPFG